jgi:hypothetical protein
VPECNQEVGKKDERFQSYHPYSPFVSSKEPRGGPQELNVIAAKRLARRSAQGGVSQVTPEASHLFCDTGAISPATLSNTRGAMMTTYSISALARTMTEREARLKRRVEPIRQIDFHTIVPKSKSQNCVYVPRLCPCAKAVILHDLLLELFQLVDASSDVRLPLSLKFDLSGLKLVFLFHEGKKLV